MLIAILFWYGLEIVARNRHAREIQKEKSMAKDKKEQQKGGTELKDKIQQVLT